MRIYLPATLPLLREWLAQGEARPEQRGLAAAGYAVTPTLREWYREADLDELEHAAQVAASVGSLALLAADPEAAARRVVLAADVADSEARPAPQLGRAAVSVGATVAVAKWASALIDDDGADPTVRAAAAAVTAAAAGDDDAQFLLDEAEATELGWHAVQELRYL